MTQAKILSEHHTWLLHGLARFKPPSSRSRDAIGAARLEVGVGGPAGASQVTIPVVGRLREAAVTASAVLGLDETQAYFLADRVGGGERALVGEAEGEGTGKGAGGEKKGGLEEKEEQRRLVQEVVALYQEERQSLLKCLRLLLAMQGSRLLWPSPLYDTTIMIAWRYLPAVEGEVSALLKEGGLLSHLLYSSPPLISPPISPADTPSPYAGAVEGEVSALLKEGLLSNVIAQLRSLPRSQPPKALDRAGMAGWAEASSLEACLLLDILILILIASRNGCRAAAILDIVTLVQLNNALLPFSCLPLSFLLLLTTQIFKDFRFLFLHTSHLTSADPISSAAESLLSTALHRAVLLLIAAVDVEGVVVALAKGTNFSSSQHPLSSPSDLSQVDQRLSAWLSCLLSAAAATAKGGAGGRGQSEEFDDAVGMAEEGMEEVYGAGGGGRLIGLGALVPLVGTGSGAGAGSDVSPVLLAWGLIRMLLQWLPDSSQLPPPTLNPGVCVQAAYAAGALDWILSSLLSSSLPSHPSNDPVMQGVVKRCVKGLCTAYLTAFDISNQKGTRLYALLLEIICRTFSDQESLCTDFWDASASPSDAPLRSLLAATRRDFPARPLPFLRLLSALSHGSWPARCT
ncbi:unnamed protein product [Closterium sp. Yama58-4]|nr:unnamed protein product [Closterium sp. Yama58-4]